MATDCRDGRLLLRGPSRYQGDSLPGVSGAFGLCCRPVGAVPVWGGEARLRQMPGPLLSACSARTGQGGDALCRPAHVVAASDSEPAPLARWLPQGARGGLNGKRGVNAKPPRGKDAARPSRTPSRTGFNAETQRNAEKRREEELSANLCEPLRISACLS